MFGIKKEVWVTAGMILAVVAVTAFVQRKVIAIPIVGDFLPK